MKMFHLFSLLIAFTLLLSVAFVSGAYSADGEIIIKSPAYGEVVNGSAVMVEMEIEKGTRGDHIHFYLDGENLGVVRVDKYKLTDMAKGKHKVEARLASKGHAEIGPKGIVEFTVE